MDIFWSILGMTGVVSTVVAAAVGFGFKRIERKIEQEHAEREKREQARREYERFQVRMITATAKVCEANAIALQNGRCNGETHAALEVLDEVRRDQRDFLTRQGIDHLF